MHDDDVVVIQFIMFASAKIIDFYEMKKVFINLRNKLFLPIFERLIDDVWVKNFESKWIDFSG